MHAISSYRGNRPTHKHANAQTHRQDRLQYTAQLITQSSSTAVLFPGKIFYNVVALSLYIRVQLTSWAHLECCKYLYSACRYIVSSLSPHKHTDRTDYNTLRSLARSVNSTDWTTAFDRILRSRIVIERVLRDASAAEVRKVILTTRLISRRSAVPQPSTSSIEGCDCLLRYSNVSWRFVCCCCCVMMMMMLYSEFCSGDVVFNQLDFTTEPRQSHPLLNDVVRLSRIVSPLLLLLPLTSLLYTVHLSLSLSPSLYFSVSSLSYILFRCC